MPDAHPPTGIVLLNLGGPASLDEVEPFLLRLFADRELISLPAQALLGPLIARLRAPKVRERYRQIGGGSPILHWTQAQARGLAARLDERAPDTAPHRCYIAFRYAAPFASDALAQMRADGVQRAVAFSQYPQFSTTTGGASLNELYRAVRSAGLADSFQWQIIDRWYGHPGYIEALAETIQAGLATFPAEAQDKVLLLFSAHSLPLKVVQRGDPYPQEVEATVRAVLGALNLPNRHVLSYQSKVGPVRWLEPGTAEVIRRLGREKQRSVLVVPVSFTSDHIETLHEIDIEYRELAERAGISHFRRAPALNDSPRFLDALADIVKTNAL